MDDFTALLGLLGVPVVGVQTSTRRRLNEAFQRGIGPDPHGFLAASGVPIREKAGIGMSDFARQAGARPGDGILRHRDRHEGEEERRLRGNEDEGEDETELYMGEDEQEHHLPWESEDEDEDEAAEAKVLHYLAGARDALKTLSATEDEGGILSHAHTALDAAVSHLRHRRAWRSDSPLAAERARASHRVRESFKSRGADVWYAD